MVDELLEAKKRLYSLLLQKDKLTDSEVNVMYDLCRDEQIQAFLRQRLKPGQPRI